MDVPCGGMTAWPHPRIERVWLLGWSESFHQNMADDEGLCIYDGSLYTVEERLETFKKSHWPYDRGSCTPQKVNIYYENNLNCYQP